MPRDQFEPPRRSERHSPITIEADPSARSFADVQLMVKHRMVDSVDAGVPKLAASANCAHRRTAEANGVRCALSNTAGSMVGDAAAVHLDGEYAGNFTVCELGEFEVITGIRSSTRSIITIRVPIAKGSGQPEGILKIPNNDISVA